MSDELYSTDEQQWIAKQIGFLQTGQFDLLDRHNLILYLTEMAMRGRRELRERFAQLLQHLLKSHMQPQRASRRSWALTVVEQQSEIRHILRDTPSLRAYAIKSYGQAYIAAVDTASIETGIARSTFPASCPWTIAQALTMALTV
jgi:hypothetical protein